MKNKVLYYLIASLCFIGFISCDDEEDTSIQFSLYVGSENMNSVSVTSVGEILVEVRNTKGAYTVKSNNEEIATAEINEYENLNTGQKRIRVNLKGVKEGTTSITVTDSENRTATLAVDVTIKKISLLITTFFTSVEAENPTADDQLAIDKIKSEIIGKLPPVGGGFEMTYSSQYAGTLIYYPDIKKLNEKVEGTFRLNGDEVLEKTVLKFYYNNTEYIYQVSGTGILTRSTAPIQIVFIQDLKNDYSQMTKPKITKAHGGLIVRSINSF